MRFVKMEGLANDFIMVRPEDDEIRKRILEQAASICDRRRGIGADGIIFIEHSDRVDFRMRIINSDGSEAEMCGNGIRCFSLYIHVYGLSSKHTLAIETGAGIIHTQKLEDGYKVSMGPPVLKAADIPTTHSDERVIQFPLEVEGQRYPITSVGMGNPHAVMFSDELSDELVLGIGPKIEAHPFFPNKTNVEFVRVDNSSEITMRVFERGCGETMACGTGACAAVVAGILNKKHNNRVLAHLTGGDLEIEWDGDPQHPVFMTGPAREVFEGTYLLQ
ncbi:MAG: diaminopimelate epimerase [Fibrobacterota bacterium]